MEGIKREHIGETHRSFWDRASEYQNALREKDESYGVVKHWLEEHNQSQEPPRYEFKVMRSHKTSLNRQIWEALAIEGADPSTLLNTKA